MIFSSTNSKVTRILVKAVSAAAKTGEVTINVARKLRFSSGY